VNRIIFTYLLLGVGPVLLYSKLQPRINLAVELLRESSTPADFNLTDAEKLSQIQRRNQQIQQLLGN
jgi:hypothetical protein